MTSLIDLVIPIELSSEYAPILKEDSLSIVGTPVFEEGRKMI